MIQGKIVNYDGNKIYIIAEYGDIEKYTLKKYERANIELIDGRGISRKQQKSIYALLRDISLYTGYTPEEIKQIMKYDYLATYGGDMFSLASVDMTTARKFQTHLIEFVLKNDIPCSVNLLEEADDIGKYIYMCLIYKKCCISGKKSELHHVDSIGMGRNRNEVTHTGMRAMPLSRKYHNEVHTIGQQSFNKKYHVFGVKIDEVIASKYKQIKE